MAAAEVKANQKCGSRSPNCRHLLAEKEPFGGMKLKWTSARKAEEKVRLAMGEPGSNRALIAVRTPVGRQKLDQARVLVSAETVQGAISGGHVRAGSIMLLRS